MNYQRSRIKGEPSARFRQRLWAGALVTLGLTLVALIAIAFASRPLPREKLPTTEVELRHELTALHRADGPCVRWARPEPLTDDEVAAFTDELGKSLAVDLHTVLPVLSAVRLANTAAAREAHRLPPDKEFLAAAHSKLGVFDRLRLTLRQTDNDTLFPAVQRLRAADKEAHLDAGRLELFEQYLGSDATRARALVVRWRVRLASRAAQGSLVGAVAEDVSRRRIDAIQTGLADYRTRFGSYPPDLHRLVEHLRMTETLSPLLMRGVERDGSVRDGWLRPFEYFRVGQIGYRLTSEGPTDTTDMDDLIVSEIEGISGSRTPGMRQGEDR